MILFIKGPLEVLNFFIDCMAEKISNPVIVDTSDKYIFFRQISLIDNMIDESTYVITFNNIGLNFTFGNKNEKVLIMNLIKNVILIYCMSVHVNISTPVFPELILCQMKIIYFFISSVISVLQPIFIWKQTK